MKSLAWFGCLLLPLVGCSTHHWAPIDAHDLPPPPSSAVRHSSRLLVELGDETDETQCVVYQKLHPVCFYNLRRALEAGLTGSLWPSFPEVEVGSLHQARPNDYVLQVDVLLDALPPDGQGPGWSAGARGRFRLIRGGQVLHEETTAARSRGHFAYGTPLGEGATEAIDATIQHMVSSVFGVPEPDPLAPPSLPQVAFRTIQAASTPPSSTAKSAARRERPGANQKRDLLPPPNSLAKSAP